MEPKNISSDVKTMMLPLNILDTNMTSFSLMRTIDISFENLSYSVPVSFLSKERKFILQELNGCFKSGELTAIMGPSGAGKSSLLNVLSGFIKEGVTGRMFANEEPVDTRRAQTKRYSAYIMHQDHLNSLFTVAETMQHAANLKLGNRYSHKEKSMLINKILQTMTMTETKDTRCGQLSGGERKRLNVCLELIDNPPILFLDEPTSGLDSSNSRLLVTELKELAKSNRTVICTIHQPSAILFALFDHLYLIESGKTVYQGDTSNLLPFLNHIGLPCPLFHNPADFVMDVVCGEFGNYTDILITSSQTNKWRNQASVINNKGSNWFGMDKSNKVENIKPSEWTRYTYLVGKICRHQHRDWVVTYLKAVIHGLSALSIGTLFYNYGDNATKVFNNTIYLFLTSVYIGHTTVMPATVKFPNQLLVLKREHFNNWYSFQTFFLAFLTVNIPLQLLFSAIFLAISYLMTSQPLEWYRCYLFAASCALETIITDMFGLMMGTANVTVNGIFVGSAYMLVTTILGGYFVPLRDVLGFLRFMSYFSFIRYSFELKLTAIYGLGREKFICPETEFYCHVRYPKHVFDWIGLEDGHITRDLTVLCIFAVGMIVLAFFRLRYCLMRFH